MYELPEFKQIASRQLIFVSAAQHRMEVFIAIGEPYRPARTPGMAELAACQVLTCDDPALASEVTGRDEMEALAAAVEFLDLFLINTIRQSGGGALFQPDGTVYDPSGSVQLREFRRIAARSANVEGA